MCKRLCSAISLLSALGAVLAGPPIVHAQSAPAIIEALRTGDLETVSTLVAEGADVNAPQGDGATALHWAAHRNDLDVATLLIEAGADVNTANTLGATPLWLAAINGSAPMVERLLESGADPDVSLKMGETPLMTAARSGDLRTVELLLEYGADVNAVERERGQTALMWAVAQKHADVTRLLIESDADVYARSDVWYQLENTAGNTNPSGNFRMAHGGSTPLLFVARNGDVETARVLVEQGADPNAAEAGYTALHAAVLRGQVELAEALLDHGADLNAVIEHGTAGRRFSADYSIRRQLIGTDAFWLAAKYGEVEILRRLVERGADPLVVRSNMTALQVAMGNSGSGLENRRDRIGNEPPDQADEEQRTLELARILIDLGVDVNATSRRGDTALHDAVRKSYPSVIEFLVANGADINGANQRGQTPLALAETVQGIPGTNGLRGTRPEIAELLRRLGAVE